MNFGMSAQQQAREKDHLPIPSISYSVGSYNDLRDFSHDFGSITWVVPFPRMPSGSHKSLGQDPLLAKETERSLGLLWE